METARRIVAVLIGLRALPNLGKPFRPGAGFVILGRLRYGAPSTVVGPLFGLLMLVYVVGLWRGRAWARPLGVAYAIWATVNVVLFPFVQGVPARFAPAMYLVFAIPGLVVPWLAVWLLARR